MKKIISSIGKAVCYMLSYLFIQVIAMIAVIVFLLVSNIVTSGDLASNKLLELITNPENITNFILTNLGTISFVTIIISTVLAFILFFLIAKIRHVPFSTHVGFGKIKAKKIPMLVLFGAALNFVISFIISYIPASMLDAYSEASASMNTVSFLSVFSGAVCAPLIEEVIFRGYALSRLKNGVPYIMAILIQAAVFGIMHGQILWMCYAFVLGVIFGLVCNKYKSVWASIAVHIGFNGFSYLLLATESALSEASYIVIGILSIVIIIIFLVNNISSKRNSNPVENDSCFTQNQS